MMLASAIIATVALIEVFIGIMLFAWGSRQPLRDFIAFNVAIIVIVAFASAWFGVGMLWELAL